MNFWVAAIDFRKAFDTVRHVGLWDALLEQRVPEIYVNVLQRLYCHQVGRVQLDCVSRTFSIGRGTKQGDPISPCLFNAVLENVMRKCKARWLERGWGIQVGTGAEGFFAAPVKIVVEG